MTTTKYLFATVLRGMNILKNVDIKEPKKVLKRI